MRFPTCGPSIFGKRKKKKKKKNEQTKEKEEEEKGQREREKEREQEKKKKVDDSEDDSSFLLGNSKKNRNSMRGIAPLLPKREVSNRF